MIMNYRAVNKVAEKYTEQLAGTVKTPVVAEGYLSSWAQYTIQLNDVEERDDLQIFLREKRYSYDDILSEADASSGCFCRIKEHR